jgi:hypothetical protein
MAWKVGENPLSKTFEEAKKRPLPDFVMVYDNPKLRLLVGWCKVLQKYAGKTDVFFLSVRKAGEYLKEEPNKVSRWFFLLVEDEVLKVVEKGRRTPEGDKATRFRYIAEE